MPRCLTPRSEGIHPGVQVGNGDSMGASGREQGPGICVGLAALPSNDSNRNVIPVDTAGNNKRRHELSHDVSRRAFAKAIRCIYITANCKCLALTSCRSQSFNSVPQLPVVSEAHSTSWLPHASTTKSSFCHPVHLHHRQLQGVDTGNTTMTNSQSSQQHPCRLPC